MGTFPAVMGDQVVGVDTHIVMVPAPPGPPVPTPLPHPFSGKIAQQCSTDVKIGGKFAATVASIAVQPPHIPTPPGTTFQKPPMNQGKFQMCSKTVMINGKQAARITDMIYTCNDPMDAPTCKIIPSVTNVTIGG